MHGADALVGLGGAFLAAAFLARLGGRIGLPTIPLFMIAGIIFGPHAPGIALISDPSELRLVASLGLVFLLFYLGLEFSVDQLVSGGRRLLGVSIAYLLLNVGGGLLFGLALGWGIREALIIAGVLGISSSAIVTKLLLELGRLDRRESPVILGIIVVEDVFLALYLALLQPVLSDSVGAAEAGRQIATAFGFLLVLALIARFGSRIVDALFTTHSEELLVVTAVGLAVLGAGVAEMLGVSDAIGAFMVGMILGSTSRAAKLRQLVHPLRDLFGAIFFFAFGLTIDPAQVFNVWPIVLAAVATTGLLASLAGIVAARSYGFGRSEASAIGLTVFSRGEFSLILATLALAAGLDPRITSLTAGYVLVLAVVGPLAATHSDRIAHLLPAGWFKSQLATR